MSKYDIYCILRITIFHGDWADVGAAPVGPVFNKCVMSSVAANEKATYKIWVCLQKILEELLWMVLPPVVNQKY